MAKSIHTKTKTAAPAKRAATAKPAADAVNSAPAGPAATPQARRAKPATAPIAPAPNGSSAPASVPARLKNGTAETKSPKVRATRKAAKPAAAKLPASKPRTVAPRSKSKIRQPAPPAPPPFFTQDDISLRAYFLAQQRHAEGRHGDPHSDWVEAERQLRAEHGILG